MRNIESRKWLLTRTSSSVLVPRGHGQPFLTSPEARNMYFRLAHVPRGTSRRQAREGPTAPSRPLAPQSRPAVPSAPGTRPCVRGEGRERRAAQSRLVRFGCAVAGADGRWAEGRVWGPDRRYGVLAPDRWGGSRGSRQAKSEGLKRPGRSLSSGSRVLALGERGWETGDGAHTSEHGRFASLRARPRAARAGEGAGRHVCLMNVGV